ncbi:MAG: aminopeptidase P family protein [Candidatus Magasanikbacteria bacterium]|nr:aminopeptidase P family protein [Candidatus Magasanikbacteria bacterium]
MRFFIQTFFPRFSRYRLNAILIADLLNVRYLSGFTGTNGLILITKKQKFFFTDSRYTEQAKQEVKGFALVRSDRDLFNTILKILPPKKLRRLGFAAGATAYAQYLRLQKGLPGVTLVPMTEDPAEWRIIKTKIEIEKVAKALAINKLAWAEIRPQIKPGAKEIDIARKLECALLKHGAERIGFDTIVASGWRGALPHGKASDKKIRAGELVTIDFGGVYQGYHADETVTIGVGKLTPKQKMIWQIVYDAQLYAMEKVRPGVKCSDIDKAARDYIAKQGYGKYFGHALGHGVGLEVHERPVLSPTSKDILAAGMVFTIEPGIYLPGWGGARLEEVFVCNKNGPHQLTQIDKKLFL